MARSPRARLVLNPTLRLTASGDVSRRGAGRRRVELTDPALLRYVLAALEGRARPRLDAGQRHRLCAAGVLVRRDQIPRDVHLDARLDVVRRNVARRESPHRNVARRAAPHATRSLAARPRLARGCRLTHGPALPPGLTTRGGETFLPDTDVLWVPSASSRVVVPYTLTPRLAAVLRRRPGLLSSDAARALSEAGALHTPGVGRDWTRRLQAWRSDLRSRGFVVLRDLFAARFLIAVRTYYRRVAAEGYLLGGDARRRGAPLLHDEPLLDFLARQLAPVVRRITGERGRATFTYLRVYDPGARLGRHRDRAQSRWTMDLVVGGTPAPDVRTAWPLWLRGRRGAQAVRLGLGDAVLYRGDRIEHWRRAQPRGRRTVLASLHFGATR